MDGNNFLENNSPNKKPNKKNEEREIDWVSPESDFADKKNLLKEYGNSVKKTNAKAEIGKKQAENILSASKSSASGALKTNLVKEDVTTFVNWRKNIIFLLFGIIFSFALIGGLYGRLVFSEQRAYRTSDELDAEIAELKNRIYAAKENNQEAEKFQQKLKLAGGLLEKHTYWTNFFEFLEANILSDTYINGGVSANFGTDFAFDISAKTFANIDEQLLVLKENGMVKEASVKSGLMDFDIEKGSSRIKYSLEIEVLPEIFLKK